MDLTSNFEETKVNESKVQIDQPWQNLSKIISNYTHQIIFICYLMLIKSNALSNDSVRPLLGDLTN